MPEAATLSGVLHADFTQESGRTSARITRAAPPLELRGPFVRGASSGFFLRNISCGVFGGDLYDVQLRAEESTSAFVRPTSATKVHPTTLGEAIARVHLEAGNDALLAYTDGPTILQAASSYEQRVSLVIGDGLILYAEIIVLGRLAARESVAFHRYANEITVSDRDGREIYVERYALHGPDRELINAASPPVIGKLLVVGKRAESYVINPPLDEECAVYVGADALPEGAGIGVRLSAETVEPVTTYLEQVMLHAASRTGQIKRPGHS